MKKKNLVLIIIVIIALALAIHYDVLEIVPESKKVVASSMTGPWGSTYLKGGRCWGIEFVVPEGVNILTDVDFVSYGYTSSGSWPTRYAGFSKVLSYNQNDWECRYSFCWSCYHGVAELIKDARTPEGTVIRCNPGETWYVMIKASGGDPEVTKELNTGSKDSMTTYYSTGGEFTVKDYDIRIRVYGEIDEPFYVDFEFSPEKPVINEPIIFTDASNQNLLEYRNWMIDNQVVGTGSILNWTFTEPNIYHVILVGISYEGTNLQMDHLIDVRESWPDEPEPEEFPYWLLALLGLGGLFGLVVWKRKRIL